VAYPLITCDLRMMLTCRSRTCAVPCYWNKQHIASSRWERQWFANMLSTWF